MCDRNKSVKLTERSHADIIAWLDENEIKFQPLVIHLLRVAMTIGTTQAPPDLVEDLVNISVEPEDDLMDSILGDLDLIG